MVLSSRRSKTAVADRQHCYCIVCTSGVFFCPLDRLFARCNLYRKKAACNDPLLFTSLVNDYSAGTLARNEIVMASLPEIVNPEPPSRKPVHAPEGNGGVMVSADEKAVAAPFLVHAPARILELDGFRAAAVLAVLFHHLFYGWLTPALSKIPGVFLAFLSRGWLGVDLFFVLSGFLITGILLDSKETEHYFRNFYTRRILRIVPLYLACILLMYFCYPDKGAYFGLSLVYLANFAHLFRVPKPHGPGVFWSLAIEEHFYLIWPLVVRLLNKAWLIALILFIVLNTPILQNVCAHANIDPKLEIYPYS